MLVILIFIAIAAPPAQGPDLAIANLAARAIEGSSPVDHHAHGHELAAGDRLFCGVDVFGTDPPNAPIEQVWTVYGYYFCAAGSRGVPYLQSARSDGPVVVTQLSAAPLVLIARSGPGYADRVRAMMPDQYEQWCFSGLRDDSVASAVRRRYEAEVGA